MELFRFLLALQERLGEKWYSTVSLSQDFKVVLVIVHSVPPSTPMQICVPLEPIYTESEMVEIVSLGVKAYQNQLADLITSENKGTCH